MPFEPFDVGINYTIDSCDPSLAFGDNILKQTTIYPNPVDDILYLTGEIQLIYKIVDSTGKIIRKGKLNEEKSIYVGELKSDLYLLELISSDNKITVKFIKK